ncbi:MAG TPA: hypothetical protein VGZ27_01685 [Vicinamibacterales bacterium]|nr:hypothetical protein [Vicinamibacterales bacterium]
MPNQDCHHGAGYDRCPFGKRLDPPNVELFPIRQRSACALEIFVAVPNHHNLLIEPTVDSCVTNDPDWLV